VYVAILYNSLVTLGLPSGFTGPVQRQASGQTFIAGYKALSASGATGTFPGTASDAGNAWTTLTGAFK
jgi:hypothetical protein